MIVFRLVRHVCFVFRREDLLVSLKHTITGNVLIGLRAQKDAERRTIIRALDPLVVHADVHIHLPDVLVFDLLGLEVDEHEATEEVIIENEVDVVVLLLSVDPLLPCNEGIALPHFE